MFHGTIGGYDPIAKMYLVEYDDGDTVWHDMSVTNFNVETAAGSDGDGGNTAAGAGVAGGDAHSGKIKEWRRTGTGEAASRAGSRAAAASERTVAPSDNSALPLPPVLLQMRGLFFAAGDAGVDKRAAMDVMEKIAVDPDTDVATAAAVTSGTWQLALLDLKTARGSCILWDEFVWFYRQAVMDDTLWRCFQTVADLHESGGGERMGRASNALTGKF